MTLVFISKTWALQNILFVSKWLLISRVFSYIKGSMRLGSICSDSRATVNSGSSCSVYLG